MRSLAMMRSLVAEIDRASRGIVQFVVRLVVRPIAPLLRLMLLLLLTCSGVRLRWFCIALLVALVAVMTHLATLTM